MKNTITVFVLALMILMESCATQKFDVHGTPGTIVTSLDGKTTLAVIGQNGTAKVKLKRKDGYDPFLLAKAPNSDKNIPFALDYKDRNRTTVNTVLGFVLFCPPITAIGLLGPSWILYNRTGSQYDYNYLKHQNTNNDLIR
ncbi:MAG: hypothetical protein K6G25_00315 [Bacteroidales bacterium]|nr:hypothetical protein [Bacteroidales bacterium]